MNMLRFFFSALIMLGLMSVYTTSFAAINYTVTPIKYNLTVEPGETITVPASIQNNGDEAVTMPTAISDFVVRDLSGTPRFVRKSELVFPDQQLSTWVSLSESSVTLAPGEKATIDVTIEVPEDATPGGHYGAVFFKNPGSETSTGGNIGINVDYGILILIAVSGDVTVDIRFQKPVITPQTTTPITTSTGSGGRSIYDRCAGNDTSGSIYDGKCEIEITTEPSSGDWYIGKNTQGEDIYQKSDECPLGDFTPSKFDGACYGSPFEQSGESEELLFSGDQFGIDFSLPVENGGNIHVAPTGKIILTDSKGNVLQAVGKQSIINEYGAIIGEEIVDYIPLNDQGGSVLPQSTRVYESQWKGFPYETNDELGKKVISYRSPSEYYTLKNKQDADFLMFWERVSEVRKRENLTANIEVSYEDENGEEIVFNSAEEFPIQYVEQRVTLNPYMIVFAGLMALLIVMILYALRWWILAARKKKCWNCKETIKAHWETCPYCESIQNKKAQKRFEQQQSKTPVKKTTSTKKPVAKTSSTTTKTSAPKKTTTAKKTTAKTTTTKKSSTTKKPATKTTRTTKKK